MSHQTHPSDSMTTPRRSVQAGYCGGDCVLEKDECANSTTFRSSREMQGAPERAHGGVCLLTETIVEKNMGSCAAIVDGSTSFSDGICSPNKRSCSGDSAFYVANKQYETNDSGCVVEKTKFGNCIGSGMCAWSADVCAKGETWGFPNRDNCACENVQVGGCKLDDDTGADDTVYCAVSEKGCDEKSKYIAPLDVEGIAGYQCFLCRKAVVVEDVVENVVEKEKPEDESSDGDSGDGCTAGKLVAVLDKYPGADISRSPNGNVYMTFDENCGITIALAAKDLKRRCTDTNTVKNGCGIHVHAGLSCDYADLVLGHYYPESMAKDPWLDVRYNSDVEGTSNVDSSITMMKGSGYSAADNVGRAVVVHDAEGKRIGCGLLKEDDGMSAEPLPVNKGSPVAEGANNNPLIIGAAVSSVVALAFIVFVGVVLFRRTSRAKKTQTKKPLKTLEFSDSNSKGSSTLQDSEDFNVL